MASQGVAASSRLAQMQMKFQKKQLLEREQKKLALTGGDVITSDISVTSKTTVGNGKVRQMFDDRRRGVGIDRSHPLRPIATTTTLSVTTKSLPQPLSSSTRLAGGANVARRPIIANSTTKQSINATYTTTRSINNYHSASNSNNNGMFNNNLDELDNLDNETFPKEFSSLSLKDTHIMGSHVAGGRDFDDNMNGEIDVLSDTVVINKRPSTKTNGIKLNPVITKKSPITTTTKTNTQYRTPSSGNRISTLSKTTTTITKSPLQKTTPATTKSVKATGAKSNNTKPALFVLAAKPPPRIVTPPPGMAACQYCQRHFNEDRLDKHEDVCRKMTSKKRKIFDVSKHRVKGTEAEKYLKKGKATSSSAPKTVIAATATNSQGLANSTAAAAAGKKSNWRKKHEEFIAAIREAKKVQAYLAKGGKLSDLPPPPPSENPDYIQCPHCSRRFNVSAAERHIPKCANMKHNKPKPPGANVQKKRY